MNIPSSSLQDRPRPVRAARRTPNLARLSDSVLINHARLGDSEALDSLLSRHINKFRAYARLFCHDGSDADEICFEGCLKAIANLSRLRSATQFTQWVFAFIRNEARHLLRHQQKFWTKLEPLGINTMDSMNTELLVEPVKEDSQVTVILREKTDSLRQPLRSVGHFMLEYFEHHEQLPTVRAIAAEAHTSRGTAHNYRRQIISSWQATARSQLGLTL